MNLFRLQKTYHVLYLKQWCRQVMLSIVDGLKLLLISFVEFVLLEQIIGIVSHLAALGVFKEPDPFDRLKMCTSMPKTCFGIHWLVGTLVMTAGKPENCGCSCG